jgi:hypothetical protein
MQSPDGTGRRRVVQIRSGLSAAEHRATFARIQREGLDGLAVTMFGGATGPTWGADVRHDLDFLQHYAGIRRLEINLARVASLAPVAALAADLRDLLVGEIRDAVSLAPIADCAVLASLSLIRAKRDLDRLASLSALRRLAVTGIRPDALAWTTALPALEGLELASAELTDARFFARFPRLRALDLMRVKGLADLAPLADLPCLEAITLESVSSLARLPHLDALAALRLLVVISAKSLTDVSGLRGAAIEELALIGVPLKAADLAVLDAMPALARGVVALASRKETALVEQALGARAVASTNDLPRYLAKLLDLG